MHAYSKWATIALLAAGLATGSVTTFAAHTEGESGSSHSKKGPKYMGGGEHGSGHNSSSHKGGSSHHDSSEGGSKSTEEKGVHGKSGGHETSHTDGGTETSHTDGGTEHTH